MHPGPMRDKQGNQLVIKKSSGANRVQHAGEPNRGEHVVDPHDVGAVQDAPGVGGQAAFQALVHRKVQGITDEGLARNAQENRVAKLPQAGEVFEQLKVLRGGFPEAKVLKQRVRDQIDPDRDLGHNDRTQ